MVSLRAFVRLNAAVAFTVGGFAVALPNAFLASKGVASDAAALWMREVGVLIFALGATLFLIRNHPESPSTRAILLGNAIVHGGLLPIELAGYYSGVISELSGIVPNSLLHAALAFGSLHFAARMPRAS